MNAFPYVVTAAVLSFWAAWGIQGVRWDADVANISLSASRAQVAAVEAVNARRLEAESSISAGQQALDKVRSENEDKGIELQRLNDCLRTGKCGLRVAQKCPADLRAATTTGASSRDFAGSIGPDPDLVARALVWEREYPKQLKALRLCKVYAEQLQGGKR